MAKLPLPLGNSICLLFIAIAIELAELSRSLVFAFRLPVLIACWFAMLYFTHCPSHYVVGRLLGIEFEYYFLSKSMLAKANIPLLSSMLSKKFFLTLKIKERKPGKRTFIMFISGPLASMFSPLAIPIIVLSYDSFTSYLLFLLTAANAVFTGYYSYRFGCIRKGIDALKA